MSRTIESLNTLLADYSVLYQKLRNYHWNVRGPMFFALHAKFEELYDGTAVRVDELAERIAALGGRPLSNLKDYLEATRLDEGDADATAEAMVADIKADLETLNGALRELAEQSSEDGDAVTEGYATDVIAEQEQTVWMLAAYLS